MGKGSVSLTGSDTTVMSLSGTDRIFSDFADGDVINLEFPNELVAMKKGKNGNIIYAQNEQGDICNATVRVLRGSGDDKALNSQILLYKRDPSGYQLIEAEFVKRIGDGSGNVASETYILAGGIISKIPTAKDNVEGDTEQAVAIYNIMFGGTDRAIS